MALTSKLSAIGDAIRSKTGTTELLTLDAMVTEIEGIETIVTDMPEEAFTITGNCSGMYSNEQHNWFIDTYGEKVETSDITNAVDMFNGNITIERVPFEFNFTSDSKTNTHSMFYGCSSLKEIGALRNLKAWTMDGMFTGCSSLRYLPEFENLDMSNITSASMMLTACTSLRQVPSNILKGMDTNRNTPFITSLSDLTVVDELVDIYPQDGTLSTDIFSNVFSYCYRVKRITFAMQDDGTPYTRSWKNQVINIGLGSYVGYVDMNNENAIYDNFENNGLSYDGYVTDDDQYAALKDTNDWWTPIEVYSRFDAQSAIELIYSLPDTSAYGTNTLKLYGVQGEYAGGRLDSISEEWIAQATDRGWTVAFDY